MGDLGLIPGLGRFPGEGKGYPLQYSGLENSVDCLVHGIANSRTRLNDFHSISLLVMLFWAIGESIKFTYTAILIQLEENRIEQMVLSPLDGESMSGVTWRRLWAPPWGKHPESRPHSPRAVLSHGGRRREGQVPGRPCDPWLQMKEMKLMKRTRQRTLFPESRESELLP